MGRQPQSKQARALAISRKIIEVEAELVPLKAILAELKKEYALLFGEDADGEEEDDRAPKRRRAAKLVKQEAPPVTAWAPLGTRVLAFMATVSEHGVNIDTISEAVGGASRQTLRALLVTLTKDGSLRRVGLGVYAPQISRPALVAHR
jgi:hypothetical protein